MTPLNAMIVSGTVSALAATTTLISGAVFKRAFDQYHQAQRHQDGPPPTVRSRQGAQKSAEQERPPRHHEENSSPSVTVGAVQSENQKGGVTAGYVGSVTIPPPKK